MAWIGDDLAMAHAPLKKSKKEKNKRNKKHENSTKRKQKCKMKRKRKMVSLSSLEDRLKGKAHSSNRQSNQVVRKFQIESKRKEKS